MGDKSSTKNEITINSIVKAYADDLFRWAYYRTTDRENAEDLVQETFIAAMKSLHKFQNQSKIKTWLFSILNNKIVDFHRKRYRDSTYNQTQLSNDPDSRMLVEQLFDSHGNWKQNKADHSLDDVEENLLDDEEFGVVFQACLEDLPDKWFSVIQLKYLIEKKSEEICQELGITPSNYWQLLHRSKLLLRECLKKMWFDEKN